MSLALDDVHRPLCFLCPIFSPSSNRSALRLAFSTLYSRIPPSSCLSRPALSTCPPLCRSAARPFSAPLFVYVSGWGNRMKFFKLWRHAMRTPDLTPPILPSPQIWTALGHVLMDRFPPGHHLLTVQCPLLQCTCTTNFLDIRKQCRQFFRTFRTYLLRMLLRCWLEWRLRHPPSLHSSLLPPLQPPPRPHHWYHPIDRAKGSSPVGRPVKSHPRFS